jgi:hypothetical protein
LDRPLFLPAPHAQAAAYGSHRYDLSGTTHQNPLENRFFPLSSQLILHCSLRYLPPLPIQAAASTHAALARHALTVLRTAAQEAPGKVIAGLLPRLRDDNQLLNLSDSICIATVFDICDTVVRYGIEVDAVGCGDEVAMALYEAALKLINSRNSKVSLEALKFGTILPHE